VIDGHWLPIRDADPRALALIGRHYSEQLKKRRSTGRAGKGFVGPGQKMVLMTAACDAVFAWLNPRDDLRDDGQTGVLCSVFRNESPIRSSDLIREADDLAWQKWPDQRRHYTFVDPTCVRSVNPGYCFKKAGWRRIGASKRGRLIFERVAEASALLEAA
jgi:hypothetical protein